MVRRFKRLWLFPSGWTDHCCSVSVSTTRTRYASGTAVRQEPEATTLQKAFWHSVKECEVSLVSLLLPYANNHYSFVYTLEVQYVLYLFHITSANNLRTLKSIVARVLALVLFIYSFVTFTLRVDWRFSLVILFHSILDFGCQHWQYMTKCDEI